MSRKHKTTMLGSKELLTPTRCRELAPAEGLILTDRHLIIIAEERSSSWLFKSDRAKYGAVVTYFPRSRILVLKFTSTTDFMFLSLKPRGLAALNTIRYSFHLSATRTLRR